MTFVVHDKRYTNTKFDVSINLPGIHYVNNTLAAIAVGLEYGVSIKHIQKALKEFEGVARRYDVYRDISKNNKNFIVIDDYGHHPTEIRAVLEATKKGFPNKDIALVFQPHRYTRTKDCYDDFLSVFQIPLKLFLFDIYGAGEEPIPGISSEKLLKDITRADAYHLPNGKRANKIILDNITKDSIIVIMGAGSVGNFASQFIS
jgi:UDP-N-acetylmuramate--alanine ligase